MQNKLRQNQVIRLLAQNRMLSVTDLARELAVSPATVRRDLQDMQQRGLLNRLHGGATIEGISRVEPLFEDKQDRHPEAKQRIALAALELISDGDRIYLDGGSTVLALARLLDRKRRLVIVSNSLMAAAELMNTEHRLILVGGEFRSLSRTLVGPLTAPLVNSLRVDLAFMGTIGFSLADGMTTTDPAEAFTKELVMQRAARVVLLADHSKFGVTSFARSGSLDDIDVLVTDAAEDNLRLDLERRGITVRLAGPANGLTDTQPPNDKGNA